MLLFGPSITGICTFPPLSQNIELCPHSQYYFLGYPLNKNIPFFFKICEKSNQYYTVGLSKYYQRKKPLTIEIGLFNLDLSEKRSWSNFEGMFPDLLKYYPFFLSNKTLFCSNFPSHSIGPFWYFISLLNFSIDH